MDTAHMDIDIAAAAASTYSRQRAAHLGLYMRALTLTNGRPRVNANTERRFYICRDTHLSVSGC